MRAFSYEYTISSEAIVMQEVARISLRINPRYNVIFSYSVGEFNFVMSYVTLNLYYHDQTCVVNSTQAWKENALPRMLSYHVRVQYILFKIHLIN